MNYIIPVAVLIANLAAIIVEILLGWIGLIPISIIGAIGVAYGLHCDYADQAAA